MIFFFQAEDGIRDADVTGVQTCSSDLGGILLSGLDNGFNFAFDDEDGKILFDLPFNPLKDKEQYDYMVENDYGIQFSHTLEEQIGGQLKAGFILEDLYEDTNLSGYLHENNIPTFIATKAVKK